jgi:hypothetical protein
MAMNRLGVKYTACALASIGRMYCCNPIMFLNAERALGNQGRLCIAPLRHTWSGHFGQGLSYIDPIYRPDIAFPVFGASELSASPLDPQKSSLRQQRALRPSYPRAMAYLLLCSQKTTSEREGDFPC